MIITKEVSDLITKYQIQIKHKFGIGVGYSHPMGFFSDKTDAFIIIVNGVYNPEICDFEDLSYALVENNEYGIQHEGIMVNTSGLDLDQYNENISNFLIDFHQWLREGKLIDFPVLTIGNTSYQETGDNRVSIHIKNISCTEGQTIPFTSVDQKIQEKLISMRP